MHLPVSVQDVSIKSDVVFRILWRWLLKSGFPLIVILTSSSSFLYLFKSFGPESAVVFSNIPG